MFILFRGVLAPYRWSIGFQLLDVGVIATKVWCIILVFFFICVIVMTFQIFTNLSTGNGKVGHVNQANNMYLFPGLEFFPWSTFFLLTMLISSIDLKLLAVIQDWFGNTSLRCSLYNRWNVASSRWVVWNHFYSNLRFCYFHTGEP